MEQTVFITTDKEGCTVNFAAQQLEEYLRRAGISAYAPQAAVPDAFLKVISLSIDRNLENVSNPDWDDAYMIEIDNLEGVIKGCNQRSILLGCYRFLREIGFAFLRPDPEGERIPKEVMPHHIHLTEKAFYRYRGICIEGAVSFEAIIRFVQWMPKVGFNTYFTQFFTPYEFFRTWYEHCNNPTWEKHQKIPTPKQVDAFVEKMLVPELKRRGLLWQAVGHGFNTETFGVRGLGWEPLLPSEDINTDWLAMIADKRKLFGGVPLNTNLCYSNPQVQNAFADQVIRYVQAHPGIDLLHVWLADQGNNSCECSKCQEKLPSDWYIDLLNLVDEKLTAAKSSVKIVFLAYFDLLWPPQKEILKNPNRFVFMFAPITRSYREPLPKPDNAPLPPYIRNHVSFPASGMENMRYARAWKNFFFGDSFVYDYHYMWNHFRDWGDYFSAEILYDDLKRLGELGFNGYISCQQTRVFAPHGLGMYLMGQCLWGTSLSFKELAQEYFRHLFGPHGKAILHYVRTLSDLCYRSQPEDDRPGCNEIAAGKLEEACNLLDNVLPKFEEYRLLCDDGDYTKWNYLVLSAKAAKIYCTMLKYRREGKETQTAETYEKLKAFLRDHEKEWIGGFDLYWFIKKCDPVYTSQYQ